MRKMSNWPSAMAQFLAREAVRPTEPGAHFVPQNEHLALRNERFIFPEAGTDAILLR
jgi:hypothetical protein